MKIVVFGGGYVGLVTSACFAQSGNHVTCCDIDAKKIELLKEGKIPFYEPKLIDIVKKNQDRYLFFTTQAHKEVSDAECVFIAVNTPVDENGKTNLSYVWSVCEGIAPYLKNHTVVAVKSTVPVGTTKKIRHLLTHILKDNSTSEVEVVSNPEFLKEGSAINDFTRPDRIIVGTQNEKAKNIMRKLYKPYNRNHEKLIFMDSNASELCKLTANAMLSTKISFINEIAKIAEATSADIESVRLGIGLDPRIGPHFIYPGCGFGGSCFPKDIQMINELATDNNLSLHLLPMVKKINDEQKHLLFKKIEKVFPQLEGKVFALWGLSFKPNTDDMREAPSRFLMEALWENKASVRAYDPVAMEVTRNIYGECAGLVLCKTKEEALETAEALIICTEWQEFSSLDFNLLRKKLKQLVIFDGRNMYDLSEMKQEGVSYYGIGRKHIPIQ